MVRSLWTLYHSRMPRPSRVDSSVTVHDGIAVRGANLVEERCARRPRVLMLTLYCLPICGGVESRAHAMAQWLHCHGYETLVVAPRGAA